LADRSDAGDVWYFLIRTKPISQPHRGELRTELRRSFLRAGASFVNLSSEQGAGLLRRGIAEEILNATRAGRGPARLGSTSSFSFKGKNEDLRSIGEKTQRFGALLEGSVRKAGTRIRITATDRQRQGGYHIWSQTFDRELADVLRYRTRLPAPVVGALK